MSYSVRPVTAADVPAVVAHVRDVLAEFGIVFGVGCETDAELMALPGSYESIGGAFWVAESEDGRLVGTAGISPVGDGVFELRKMYLLPETRGHGVGAKLFRQALAHSIEAGGRMMVLDTVDQMRDAIRFYERFGFVRDDRQIRGARCTRGYALDLTTLVRQSADGAAFAT